MQDIAPEPELDPEILSALEDATDDALKFGPKIREKLSCLWQPLLRKGMDKGREEKMMKQYIALNTGTTLNPEIAAAVSIIKRVRDKRVESVQQ